MCLAAEPPSFEDDVIGTVTRRLGYPEAIEGYGIPELSVGRRVVYDVKANWKLIVENFMECYHCATIHPELTEVLPEFADGLAAQYFVGHGALFGEDVEGFTVDGSAGLDPIPGVTAEQDRRYYAITVRPNVFVSLVPDHVIFHRMYPMAADRTVVECDWLYLPQVVEGAAISTGPSSCSTGSTCRTSTPANGPNRPCRRGGIGRAACWFRRSTTSVNSTTGWSPGCTARGSA